MDDSVRTTAKAEVEQFQRQLGTLREEIAKVIVGNRDVVDGALTCMLAGSHALLEGVPGLGKTVLVKTLAESLALTYSRVQFTPDLMPADIIGTTVIDEDAKGGKVFEFRKGPIFASIVLADEINRATPKTQSALLEAMQEHRVTVAKTTYPIEEPFFVLATQNPLEMEGTYPLPEAQLDRFFFKLYVPFPTREEPVAHHVQDFVIRVLEATHPESSEAPEETKRFVRVGASPRGAQSILLAAKIRALFAGRFAASIDDVRKVCHPALRHRVLLNFEGEAEGIKTDQIIDEILRRTPEAKV